MKYMAAAIALMGLGALASIPAPADEPGKRVYESTCIACHGRDGQGTLPGVPSFRKKGGPLTKTDDELVKSIMLGYKSPGSTLAMPAKGGNPALTEADARAALKYLRDAFGR